MKRLLVCFDGTWNSPADGGDHDDIQGDVETNVARFYRAALGEDCRDIADGTPAAAVPSVPTLKWYDEGVGTHWYDHIRGGAFGFGLSRNIREGYKFLIDRYEPGDAIFIFGFSRGAYTARSLVGLIRNAGLLKREHAPADDPDDNPILMDAYHLYRTRDGSADTPLAVHFRQRYAHENVRIKCLGVWDTVGALGIPLKAAKLFNSEHYNFHDTRLSGIVENAFHAIAVDEHREDYKATLWDPQEKPGQTLEQVWFPGAHADVGGGYADQPLSDVTLRWMQDKAALNGHGLEFDPGQVPAVDPAIYRQARVTDSFGAFLGGLYKMFKKPYLRPVRSTRFGNEDVHDAVAAMRERPDYRPHNPGLEA